jgi:C4-dicarboxylate transporter, DctM subunit
MVNDTKERVPAIAGPTLSLGAAEPALIQRSVRSWIVFGVTLAVIVGSAGGMLLPVSREVVGVLALLLLLGLIFLKMPVAYAMIIPSLLGMYVLRGEALVWSQMATVPYSEVASWSLSVVPMFILMGLLMGYSGLSASIFAAARNILGWVPGGLAVGTNLAGTGLATVSGSTVATTYALARSAIPEMLKAGYNKRLAIGAVIVSGLPGQLIPPSILLVIYAGIAETPVGPQLLAGVGPGLLVSLLFSVAIMVFAWKLTPGKGRVHDNVLMGDRVRSVLRIWPVPVIVGVIVIGMFSGLFTATEAAAVAALVAMVVTFIWKRKGGVWRALAEASVSTIASVGAIFLLLVGVALLSRMFTLTGISEAFSGIVQGANLDRVGFLLVMLVVYLVLGTFMEPLAMMVLTIPILMPTLEALDISLLWYGAFAVLMGEIAIVSPPVGILSFIIHQITQEPEVNQGQSISLNDIFAAALWLLPVAILVTLILIFFPEISTWLPSLGAAQ